MLNNKKETVIVLGGTIPHKFLIERLKKRGFHTILIDYFDNPPAAEVADIHLTESALDKDVVLKIAKETEAKMVMCPCLDQQIPVACYVAEKLGLPSPFSYETALKVTNKKYMKRIMVENGIPTAKHITLHDFSEALIKDFRFPLIVKPADSNGSAGIRKVDDFSEVESAVNNAFQWSRTREVIIEEFVEGIEVSVYTYIKNKEANVLLTSQRFSKITTDEECIKCFCSIAPAELSQRVVDKMKSIATNLAVAFDVDNTPLFYQCIVSGDDVSVIEFAPRLGGGLCFRTIEDGTGFDVLDASIDSYLGNSVDVNYKWSDHYYLTHQIHANPCTLGEVSGFDELINEGIVFESYPHKNKGMKVSAEKASGARVAAFLVKSKDREVLPELAEKAVRHVKVFDEKGKEMSNKELYLTSDMI